MVSSMLFSILAACTLCTWGWSYSAPVTVYPQIEYARTVQAVPQQVYQTPVRHYRQAPVRQYYSYPVVQGAVFQSPVVQRTVTRSPLIRRPLIRGGCVNGICR